MTHQSSKIPPQRLYSLIENLTTEEKDVSKVLKPDGDNGVEWVGSPNLDQEKMIYVSKVGDDLNSGLNMNSPKLTIQEAILDAIALFPSETNQITIEVIDTGDYTDAVNLQEWIHLKAPNASLDGILDIADNCIVSFRRCQRTTAGGSCIKKTTGTGFAKIAVELLIVGDATQNGLQANSGVIHIDAGVITVDGGIGIKARNGSRVSFIVSEIQLSNGGVGIGTILSGGDPNFFSGNLLYAKDDGTGVLLESRVSGDVINIQGGSFIVDTLYDMGTGSTLNVFATEAVGGVIQDPTADINSTLAGSGTQTIARSLTTQTLLQHDGTEPTETVVDFGDDESPEFSIVNGVVTVLVEMTQTASSIEIHLIKTGGQVAEFNIWLEASGDSGVTWFAIADSMRREAVDKDGATNFVADFSFNVDLSIGGMYRVVATNTGDNTLSMQAPPTIVTANGGATGFSKKIRLIKLK